MKYSRIIIFALLSMLALVSCKKEEHAATIPVLSGIEVPSAACFGDSVIFTATVTDQTPLSTLKARLYFGEELINETVIRTKTTGTYTGKVFAPYYKDIPNGTATIELVAQNIEFGLTKQSFDVAMTRPDYPNLVLIAEDGSEYTMERTELYQYKYTGVLPQTLKAYIASPEVSAAEAAQGKNRQFWGMKLGSIVENCKDYITFINSVAGEYDVFFNILNYAAAPFENPISFGGEGMSIVDDTHMKVELELNKDQLISVQGMNLEELYVDMDFLEVNNASSATFKGVGGKFRVTLDTQLESLTVEAMNGSELSTWADGGSLWMIGWGIGKPDPAVNNVNWDTNKGLCMMKVAEGIFQVTTKLTPVTETDRFSFKIFHQKGWGGELGGSAYVDYQSDMVNMTDGGNFEPKEGVELDHTKDYVITIDVTAGIDAAVMKMEVKGGGEDDPTLRFAGIKMEQLSETKYKVETNLTQGAEIKTNGVDLSTLWLDPDYFVQSGAKTLRFLPATGKYRVTLDIELGYYVVEAMNGNELSTLADGGSLWMIGWGVGKPDPTINNVDWNTDRGLCMAKIGDNKFQIITKLAPVSEEHKFDFKFFHQKGWGGELGGDAYASYSSELLTMTESGNFQPVAGVTYSTDNYYIITVDVSGGVNAVVLTMSEYTADPTFAGMKFDDNNRVELNLIQNQDIVVGGLDLNSLWIDPDFFSLNDNGTLKFLPLSGKYRVTYEQVAGYFRVEAMSGDVLATYDADGYLWMIGGKVGKPDAQGDNNVSWNTDRGICMAQISAGVFRCTFKLIPEIGDTSFKFFGQKGWGTEFLAEDYESYQSDLVKINGGNFDQLDPNPISGDKFYTVTIDTTLGRGHFIMTMVEN